MFQKFVIITAWACILALAFATLTHVGFVYSIYYVLAPLLMRPEIMLYAHFEHVIAFGVFGALFALAYPRRFIFVCSIVFISAVALEYLQTLTPDRHGRLCIRKGSRRSFRDLRCSGDPLVHAKPPAVPKLTRSIGIQLNERASLRRHAKTIAWSAPDIVPIRTQHGEAVGRSYSVRRFCSLKGSS